MFISGCGKMRFDCTSFGISTVKLCWNSQFLGSSYWGIGERLSWSRCGGKSPSYLKPVKKPLLEFGYGYNPFLLIGCFSCNGIDVGHNAKHTEGYFQIILTQPLGGLLIILFSGRAYHKRREDDGCTRNSWALLWAHLSPPSDYWSTKVCSPCHVCSFISNNWW